MSEYFLLNGKIELYDIEKFKDWLFKVMKSLVTDQKNCPWCVSEYTIIDDDFGQPVPLGVINYCFYCGRKLRRVSCYVSKL